MLVSNYIFYWSILGSIIVVPTEAYSFFTPPITEYVTLQMNSLNRIEEPRKQRRCQTASARRSRFNDETRLRLIPSRRINWESIFDGKIIAAIGTLFTESVKDDSNRERLERKRAREAELLQKFTDMLNDPVQLNLLKKQAADSPNYVNQIVH